MRIILMMLSIYSSSFIVPKSFADQHLLLDQIKEKYKKEVGSECDAFPIYKNEDHTRERVKFLNKDFATNLFGRSRSVAYWPCYTVDKENKKVHIEIISMVFKTRDDLNLAVAKIKSVGRSNFKVKVLTRFVIKTSGDELIILYSETAYENSISRFMERI